ncbi:hypothetical protein FKP32DRAFT_15769 [Trametes sanguinea]|nr:hypothetical protein FKP32DRAFT_15769 [Trametes sanguinea]
MAVCAPLCQTARPPRPRPIAGPHAAPISFAGRACCRRADVHARGGGAGARLGRVVVHAWAPPYGSRWIACAHLGLPYCIFPYVHPCALHAQHRRRPSWGKQGREKEKRPVRRTRGPHLGNASAAALPAEVCEPWRAPPPRVDGGGRTGDVVLRLLRRRSLGFGARAMVKVRIALGSASASGRGGSPDGQDLASKSGYVQSLERRAKRGKARGGGRRDARQYECTRPTEHWHWHWPWTALCRSGRRRVLLTVHTRGLLSLCCYPTPLARPLLADLRAGRTGFATGARAGSGTVWCGTGTYSTWDGSKCGWARGYRRALLYGTVRYVCMGARASAG